MFLRVHKSLLQQHLPHIIYHHNLDLSLCCVLEGHCSWHLIHKNKFQSYPVFWEPGSRKFFYDLNRKLYVLMLELQITQEARCEVYDVFSSRFDNAWNFLIDNTYICNFFTHILSELWLVSPSSNSISDKCTWSYWCLAFGSKDHLGLGFFCGFVRCFVVVVLNQ